MEAIRQVINSFSLAKELHTYTLNAYKNYIYLHKETNTGMVGALGRHNPVQFQKKGVMTSWFINANVTVGPVQSDAIGPQHTEQEKGVGAAFRKLLLTWDMVLPTTFHHYLA